MSQAAPAMSYFFNCLIIIAFSPSVTVQHHSLLSEIHLIADKYIDWVDSEKWPHLHLNVTVGCTCSAAIFMQH